MQSISRRLYLFGALRVEAEGRALPLAGRKALNLLAYLALHPTTPHSREALAELLWPELEPDRSRRSLTDVLYRLRQTIGERWLIADEERIALRVDSDLWVDVGEFDRLMVAGDLDSVGRAMTLYAGDLLPEIYDDWILLRRAELHERFLAALSRLGQSAEERGDADSAFTAYYRLAHADPLNEAAYRGLMRVYVRLGRHATALQQYERLARLLADELKTEPLPETRALAEQIRAEQAALQHTTLQERQRFARPAFVGRGRERAFALEAVEAAIAGRGRWFAVEGLAGIGKSRFLEEVSASARWRGVMVVTGHASEFPTATPFAPLTEALVTALSGPRAAQAEMLLPVESLAALAVLYPPWRDRAPLPEMPPAQARGLFHHALTAGLQALASLSPHLIILDDMQWATPALWTALDAIAPSLAQSRMSFGIAYRRPEIEQSAGWETVQRWEREGRLITIPLGAFDVAEVTELLPAEHRPDARTIFAVTGGNPFYVTQAMIALNEGQALDNRPVLTRASALPETAREALAAAAILGNNVPFRLWAGVVDMTPTRLAEAADHLVAQYFLQSEVGGYVFAHDLIQSAIYEQIDRDHRQRLHSRAAQALSDFDRSNVRALAHHYERAGLA
ncbi:MAG TPA: BTAD domain-containing putative transcriptional regulator, partial [Anaerolineales bacterium]|nr:BTAD domain-containing putative transcriptional regulator [Anaerolineales bacterium]